LKAPVSRRFAAIVCGLTAALVSYACAVNPATGRREISFVSESQEIEMGRQSDPAATAQFGGLYPDDDLQAYVTSLGMGLAAVSERPDLPWSFKLVDHELINAFALPGGFIYVTRGIVVNMNSEAELVGVLGHEAGHVTARHGAQQMTQQQLGMIGFIGGAIFSETVRNNAGAVLQGLQLLSLKYGRDDEAQSDALGYRYMIRTGHDPHGISNVMRMLQSTSPSAAEMGIPGWMLSHPNPGDRVAANEARIAQDSTDFSGYKLGRDEFLRRLDGLVFGEDPRQGYFIENRFIQPVLAFEITFPAGWATQNSPQAVQAGAPSQDATMGLTFAEAETPEAALSGFLGQEGMVTEQTGRQRVNGLDASWAEFSVTPAQGQQGQAIRGRVLYVAHGGNVYQVLGYSTAQAWTTHAANVGSSMGTLQPVRDSRYTNVSPNRVRIIRLPSAMTGTQFMSRYPSTVDEEAVLLANQVTAEQRLERGRLMKQVTGGRVPTR
jgi:predicted Zn-dependent protease